MGLKIKKIDELKNYKISIESSDDSAKFEEDEEFGGTWIGDVVLDPKGTTAQELLINNKYEEINGDEKSLIKSLNNKVNSSDLADYAKQSDLPKFDDKSIHRTTSTSGYYAVALTQESTSEYITFEQIKALIDSGGNKQFSDEEVIRLKLLLKSLAFGYNKNSPDIPLEFKGLFTQLTIFNDLDKPEDNIITDEQGNPLEIRKVADSHYSGNTWFDENGKTSLRDYQGKLTYKNADIGSGGSGGSSYIQGEYKWVTKTITEMPTGWKEVTPLNLTLINGLTNKQGQTPNILIEKGNDKNYGISLIRENNLLKLNFKNGDVFSDLVINYLISSLWQYDPANQFSDLPNIIYVGKESWRNFEATRLEHKDEAL